MIQKYTPDHFETLHSIINEASLAYKGAIPAECFHEPYMSENELLREIADGVTFWEYAEAGKILGVMGIQTVSDAALIRHAYVRKAAQNQGVGGKLLEFLKAQTPLPMLVGTWAAAVWAIRFYEKNGFRMVSAREKNRLLEKYWSISERQVETSVVLADEKWFKRSRPKNKRTPHGPPVEN